MAGPSTTPVPAAPEHEEHDEYLEWAGGEFDPEAFDLDKANEALQMLHGRSATRRRRDMGNQKTGDKKEASSV